MMKCKICGCLISPLMGKCYNNKMCQNCTTLKEMEKKGDLAKNGLSIIDLM
jgi:hypothetical protein